jgi:hypothetical protein
MKPKNPLETILALGKLENEDEITLISFNYRTIAHGTEDNLIWLINSMITSDRRDDLNPAYISLEF